MEFKDRFRKIALISLFIAFFLQIINILGISFFSESVIPFQVSFIFILAAVFILSILISIILAAGYVFFSSLSKQAHVEVSHKKSFEEGGVKSKQIHRTLEEYEKELLSQLYKKTRNKNYDLDRRSPVFKVQGKIYKQPGRLDPYVKVPERWFVRNVEINKKTYPPIRFKGFGEGDELTVEFSPYSGYVWDVYKVQGRHRYWSMNLYPEYFDLIKLGKKTVEGRAPFGSHDLKEIKDGDYISFFNMKTGERLDVRVNKITHYRSVEDMLEKEGLNNLLPNASTMEEGVKSYNQIDNYEERIKAGGIYALRIRPIRG